MTEIEKFWINFQEKLQNKGRLVGVRLYFSKAKNKFGCDGKTRKGFEFHLTVGTSFCFIILSFPKHQEDQDLINALIAISNYPPFCRYAEDDVTFIEWSEGDYEKAFNNLRKARKENLRPFYEESRETAQA